MDQPQYCLRWNNHGSNLAGCLSRLFQKEALCDVTLVCPQQGKFQAHQTILSACSPFFEELFLEYKTPHPVVILKDYKSADIRAILEFMYLGEVNVPQSSYNEFIKTAKGLQILGLNTAENLNFKEEDNEDKDKRNNNNNDSPTSKLLPSPIVPPPIKLPHKYPQQQQQQQQQQQSQQDLDRERDRDLDRDRDERDDMRSSSKRDVGGGGGGGGGGGSMSDHHERERDLIKYDRDVDDQDRDSSPTPAEQQSSAHYSSNKRKRKNTSSLCDSSMTSTYNFSTGVTERQSDSGLPLSLGSQKLSPLCNDEGRRISPASNPSRNQIQNIKSEMSEMPGLPVLHPELLPPMNLPLHPDDMPKLLAAQGFNSSLSDHSPESEIHHPPMDHPDGIDGPGGPPYDHQASSLSPLMSGSGRHHGGSNGALTSQYHHSPHHTMSYHNMFTPSRDPGTMWRCRSCGKEVTNRWHHYHSHTAQRSLCPYCPATYSRIDTLRSHLRSKHGDKLMKH